MPNEFVIRDRDNPYPVGVTPDGKLKTDTAVTLNVDLTTQIYGWDEDGSVWQKISAAEYPPGSGQFWIGVFGEVGTRTKADNPIQICVRKELATQGTTVFVDKTVEAGKVWFILKAGVADDVAAEFNVWHGINRDEPDQWTADGTLFTQVLDYMGIDNNDYFILTVNSVPATLGTDYVIEDCPTDETKSQVRWIKSVSKPDNGDTIDIVYDAVQRVQGWFVRASSSFQGDLDAPLKLVEDEFVIMTVKNKSSNTSVVISNLGGFKEYA